MPRKPNKFCTFPGCNTKAVPGSARCEAHPYADRFGKPPRKSSAKRGYGREWRRIREQVLTSHGIPPYDWGKYDVDHRPPYDPAVEPDHLKYELVPMLHEDHSKKTIGDTKKGITRRDEQ